MPPVTRGRLKKKNSKIRSFNGRTRFCSMSCVTRVTPETVDVKIRNAGNADVKARRVQNGYSICEHRL